MSKCPSPTCISESFEAVRANISGVKFPYMFIQCAICETVIGVTEAHYSSETVNILAKELTGKPIAP